jgi:hypothetical protein
MRIVLLEEMARGLSYGYGCALDQVIKIRRQPDKIRIAMRVKRESP